MMTSRQINSGDLNCGITVSGSFTSASRHIDVVKVDFMSLSTFSQVQRATSAEDECVSSHRKEQKTSKR
jgi:hypothetical protein